MKPLPSVTIKLFVTVCVLLIIGASQKANARENTVSSQANAIFATSAADGGRLIIKRSKTLGDNLSINLMIDGQPAGLLARRHTFDRYLTPGRHVIVAVPSTYASGRWQGTLDVRQGQTYNYSASYTVSRLRLTPVTGLTGLH